MPQRVWLHGGKCARQIQSAAELTDQLKQISTNDRPSKQGRFFMNHAPKQCNLSLSLQPEEVGAQSSKAFLIAIQMS